MLCRTPVPTGHSGDGTIAVPMLWGSGAQSSSDASRLSSFKSDVLDSSTVPTYLLGFNEPDCTGSASADLTPAAAAVLVRSSLVVI